MEPRRDAAPPRLASCQAFYPPAAEWPFRPIAAISKLSKSMRLNTIPDPAGAGTNRIETGAPLCKPTPLNSISDRIVRSK